ncbi:MAG: hypothetical protein RL299_225 [Pseudomonadota bacterium]|jgi:hypothetical protein
MNAMTPTKTSVVDQIFGLNKAPLDEVLAADFAELRAEAARMIARAGLLPARITSEADQIKVGTFIAEARSFWKGADGQREDTKRPVLEAGRGIDAFFKTIGNDLDAATGPLQRAVDTYAREMAAAERARAQREADAARAKADAERAKADAAKSAGAAANAEARAENLDAKADALDERASSSTADLTRMRGEGVTISGKEVWIATITDYQAAIGPLGAIGPYLKRDALEAALTSMVRIQKAGAAWPGVNFTSDVKATIRR